MQRNTAARAHDEPSIFQIAPPNVPHPGNIRSGGGKGGVVILATRFTVFCANYMELYGIFVFSLQVSERFFLLFPLPEDFL